MSNDIVANVGDNADGHGLAVLNTNQGKFFAWTSKNGRVLNVQQPSGQKQTFDITDGALIVETMIEGGEIVAYYTAYIGDNVPRVIRELRTGIMAWDTPAPAPTPAPTPTPAPAPAPTPTPGSTVVYGPMAVTQRGSGIAVNGVDLGGVVPDLRRTGAYMGAVAFAVGSDGGFYVKTGPSLDKMSDWRKV